MMKNEALEWFRMTVGANWGSVKIEYICWKKRKIGRKGLKIRLTYEVEVPKKAEKVEGEQVEVASDFKNFRLRRKMRPPGKMFLCAKTKEQSERNMLTKFETNWKRSSVRQIVAGRLGIHRLRTLEGTIPGVNGAGGVGVGLVEAKDHAVRSSGARQE